MSERPWAAPHKALRHVLGLFQSAAGATDYGQPGEVARLKRLGGELFELLYSHAHSENEHLLAALDARAPGASAHDRADHVELERTVRALETRLSRFDGTQRRTATASTSTSPSSTPATSPTSSRRSASRSRR